MREWYLVNGSSFGTFAPRTRGLFLVPFSKKIPGHFNFNNKQLAFRFKQVILCEIKSIISSIKLKCEK